MPMLQTKALTPLHFKVQVPYGEYYQTRKIGPHQALLLPNEKKGLIAGFQSIKQVQYS